MIDGFDRHFPGNIRYNPTPVSFEFKWGLLLIDAQQRLSPVDFKPCQEMTKTDQKRHTFAANEVGLLTGEKHGVRVFQTAAFNK